MSNPTITILMPAYNAGLYIHEAIDSVLAQSFSDFELIIVDDGSTDDTKAKVLSYTDSRIQLLEIEHGGVSKALNTGLVKAKGKYVARFDADDVCYPNRLERQFSFLEKYPEYVVVGSDAEYMLEDGNHLFQFSCIGHTHQEIKGKLYFYCPFIHSSVMYRKDAVVKVGSYSLFAHNFEDYFLWTKLINEGKLCNLPETLIKVRFNPASVTIDERWRGSRFRYLKRSVINTGMINREIGNELLSIIQKQNNKKIKEGAYFALCAKKYLTDNFQPERSRVYSRKAIAVNPYRLDNYFIWVVSLFPESMIKWLHHKSPNQL
jgi:glycosyltransferase involved in cell wall biosynthesis